MKKISRRILTIVIAVVILVSIVMAGLFYQHINSNKSLEEVSITDVNVVYSGILYVAENQGYFTQNGLNVTFQDYPNSEAGFNDLANGKVDIVQSAEYPIVGEVFDNRDVRVVATIDKADVNNLIGRKDHGIENVSTLVGKKIGVGEGTIREFYLGRYLNLNGISLQDVTLVYLSLQESVDAVVNGTIDAMITPDAVWYNRVVSKLENNSVVFPVQQGQPVFTELVCRSDYLTNHSQTITKLLNALYQAEIFILDHPKEAEVIVQKRLNLTSADVGWDNYRFSLSLDLPLVTAMRDEARWMITNGFTNQTQVPDFTNYIYTDALKLVKPYSVTINVGG
ncbi:MAG: ABC transporter substrate-binding protein [Candidatus Bathyarchaeia archaeon]|jgi:NitT/TauT family transport system substrate-binding protein